MSSETLSKRICAVIPCYGDGHRLPGVLAGLEERVDMVVVVDDGSQPPIRVPDSNLPVEVIRLPQNRGVGGAIIAGYARAKEMGCHIAVVLAGDGQMDPDDIPALVKPVQDGKADYCKGERFTHPEAGRIPMVRKWGNYALTYLTMVISGYDHLLDAQCGYTAIDLDTLFEVMPVDLVYPRYGFPNDMLILASAVDLRLAQVSVRPIYNGQKSGLKPFLAFLTYPVILTRGLFIKLWLRIKGFFSNRRRLAGPYGDQFLPYW